MNGLQENLRTEAACQRALGWSIAPATMESAADEIDRLEADLAAARAEVERLTRQRSRLLDGISELAGPQEQAARPRPRPDREGLARIIYRNICSPGDPIPFEHISDEEQEALRAAGDAVAAALDAAPLPTGTGRPDREALAQALHEEDGRHGLPDLWVSWPDLPRSDQETWLESADCVLSILDAIAKDEAQLSDPTSP